MESVSAASSSFLFSSSLRKFKFSSPTSRSSQFLPAKSSSSSTLISCVLKTPFQQGTELGDDDVLHIFLKERELNGDFISKVSDIIWLRGEKKDVDGIASIRDDATQFQEEPLGDDNDGGFLKLTKTNEWLSGGDVAPVNRKPTAKELQDDRERRKRLNLLKYEANKYHLKAVTNVVDILSLGRGPTQFHLLHLKCGTTLNWNSCLLPLHNLITTHGSIINGNLWLESKIDNVYNWYEFLQKSVFVFFFLLVPFRLCIGTACSGYCLVTLSVQAAVSYATGVLFSCLYLQLLCQHADNLSKENVPQIFMRKKTKKIGIRSQDLEDLFERLVKGCGMALSSSRLVIPAAIYGLWEVSQHFTRDFFDFQLVPAMVGIFAYKAAALVQVYRDNEDLQLIFPDSD